METPPPIQPELGNDTPNEGKSIDRSPGEHPSRENPFAAPRIDDDGRGFSLASLMLMVTAVCVCLAIGVALPGVGIGLAILSLPAWVRTSSALRRRSGRGLANSAQKIITVFAVSFGLTLLVLLSGVAGAAAVCLPAVAVLDSVNFRGESGIGWLMLSGLIAVIVAIVCLVLAGRKLLPINDDEAPSEPSQVN